MAGNDVDIYIRGHNGQAIRVMRDTEGRLRDMRGRFVSESDLMSGAMNKVTKSIGSLLPVATAAIPVTAALGAATLKTAGAAGGAVLSLAAFGAAVAGQVSSLSEAAEGQKKYEDAVVKSGRGSKEAAEAQRAVTAAMAGMPEATQRAAVGLQTLKDTFQSWSDGLAGFTMAPAEKSFALMGRLLPELTPMVEGASAQLGRLMDVAGGAMNTPGFDALSEKVSAFANSALKDAVDGTIHFIRTLSEGEASGPIKAFLDYAAQNGPAVRDALSSLGGAVATLSEAAAAAGPGMLTLVGAAADLVASFPPELITVMMQTAVALKAVTLAGAGVAAISGGLAAARVQIAALGATSAAAGGGVAGLRAAFLSLGTAAKASIVVAGIAAVVVAVTKLSDMGREAPPNVDKLTTSLGQLGRSGKASGEAARLFGSDLDGLYESVRNITDPTTVDNVQNAIMKIATLGMGSSTPSKEARERLDAIDEGLTNLVRGGKADVAAAAFKRLSDEYVDNGGKLGDFTGQMDGYKSSVADLAFEQELVADSMGIFGEAAQNTSAKLDAQKGAADGLRASILALNDVNRSAHDAQTQFEGALDALTASFAEHGATLNADTEAGRANRDAMSAASAAQDELLASGIAAGESLGSMTKKSSELREEMMRLAVDAFDGNKQKATEYVNTLLGVPSDIKTMVTAEKDEAIAGLQEVRAAIQATPGAKSIKVDALNGAAIAALEAVGLKTRQLPDGRTEVYTANGQALGNIGAVSSAMNRIDGRTATTTVTTKYRIIGNPNIPSGTYYGSTAGRSADGNIYAGRSYADGGVEQHVAQIAQPTYRMWAEPETGGEAYIPLAPSKRPRSRAIAEETVKRLGGGSVEWFAKGGLTDAERSARADLRGQFGMNRFAGAAGWSTNSFQKGLGAPSDLAGLVAALSQARTDIKAASSGRTESSLLRTLDAVGRRLIGQEKALGRVNASLEKARDKLDSLKSAAASLSSSVKSGILTSANITRGANSGRPVTVSSIMGGLTESRDKGFAFAQALKDLKKMGLDKGLIEEIAQAGTEGGGLETAGALLGASGSEIASLNDLRAQIVKSAGSAGSTAADAMYGAGIKAAEGLVKGLQSQQDAIEKQMMRIAKSMESAIKKALGIKSPSKVMEEVGDYTAEGFAVGVEKNRSVQPAWASMLNAPRGGRSGGGRDAAGGQQEVKVVLEIRGTGNSRYQDFLVDELQRAVRARGSIEATLKPPRGR